MIFILHRNDRYVPDVPRFCDQHETLLTIFSRQSLHSRTHSRAFIYTRMHLTAIYKSVSDKIYFPLRQVSLVGETEYITKVRQGLECSCYSTLLGEKYQGLFFIG